MLLHTVVIGMCFMCLYRVCMPHETTCILYPVPVCLLASPHAVHHGCTGVGTAIEFWKVTKAMDVKFSFTEFPFLTIKDRASYSQHATKQIDAEATRYLSYALYPLVIGYSIYALIYETHRSWYSWILNSLVGAVYTFGFILMCPQVSMVTNL